MTQPERIAMRSIAARRRRHGRRGFMSQSRLARGAGGQLVCRADAAEEREKDSRPINVERLEVLKREIAMEQRQHQSDRKTN